MNNTANETVHDETLIEITNKEDGNSKILNENTNETVNDETMQAIVHITPSNEKGINGTANETANQKVNETVNATVNKTLNETVNERGNNTVNINQSVNHQWPVYHCQQFYPFSLYHSMANFSHTLAIPPTVLPGLFFKRL